MCATSAGGPQGLRVRHCLTDEGGPLGTGLQEFRGLAGFEA